MYSHRKIISLMLSLILAVMVLTSCGGGTGAANDNGTITINFAVTGSPTTNTAIAVLDEWLLPEVNTRLEDTAYQISWNMMYGATAFAAGEELTGLGSGIADMSCIVAPYESSKLPLQNISYWFPFTTTDPEIAAKVALQLTEEFPDFAAAEEEFNVKMLTWAGMQLPFNVFANFSIESLDDFQGHKIGAGGPNLEQVTACGATPVQSTASEAYTSIQTGVYDGWINDISSVVKASLFEVAPYYLKTNFGVVNNIGFGMNMDFANTLPDEVMTVIEEVFDEYPLKVADALKAEETEVTQAWIDGGGEVVEISESTLQEWAQNLAYMPAEKAAENNATEIAKRYYELMEENGHEWLYEVEWAE